MTLSGKVVVITGSGTPRGIGRALAEAFAREGAHLVLNHLGDPPDEMTRHREELEQTAASVNTCEGDISRPEVAQELISTAISSHGRVDVLINNAYISEPAPVHEITVEAWDRMMAVNLRSVFLTTKYVLPYMVERQYGRLINMASQIGQLGGTEHAHYAASKAAIVGFTKSVAREVGRHGITANCIAPGPIDTHVMATIDPTWRATKLAQLVIPRFGRPEEVAPTAVFLASDPHGSLYTGQTLGPNLGDVMP